MGNISINGISGGTAPYTIKVYQVGNGSPIFTDTTNTSSYTGTFTHTNGQSYYAVVEKNGCTGFTSGNTSLNCQTCQLTASSLSYDCYSSTHYTLTFNISGGDGNYLYSKNGGATWSPAGSVFVDNIVLSTSSILIAKSDFSCQTTVNLNSSVNPCELCFNLSYNSVNVSCVTGSTERKRVTMDISNNITSGCPSGDYQYSDDNGNTWTTTTSSFNKVYDGYGGNTILLRYSLYPSKIWTVNVPAFNIPSCNEGYYYVANNCSCQFNGGVSLGGDFCGAGARTFQSIPNSPSTYVSSITNPGDSNPNNNLQVPIYIAFYSPMTNMRLVFSKTGGTFLNGTTTYDTGYIGGVYMFKHILGEGQTVSFTIRSQMGGINCASVVTICGDAVGGSVYTWDVACSGLPNNQASVFWNEAISF